jgi:hypothetical protein
VVPHLPILFLSVIERIRSGVNKVLEVREAMMLMYSQKKKNCSVLFVRLFVCCSLL